MDGPLRIRLLGTAAGGGLPQWNCACSNCQAARAGRIPRRTQSCVALGNDAAGWTLINASPDLPTQIEGLAPPHAAEGLRRSPVKQVLLSNADLDHVLGLFTLREGAVLHLHATTATRKTVSEGLRLEAILGAFCRAEWHGVSEAWHPLGEDASIQFRAIPLPGGPPPYARDIAAAEAGHSIAYEIHHLRTDKRAVIAPDVAEITPDLRAAIEQAEIVLFDGTFWSDEELRAVKPGARTAREMGHIPISGGSLEFLRPMPARYKGYLHINNTNPILNPLSPENAAVQAAGLIVYEDGAELLL